MSVSLWRVSESQRLEAEIAAKKTVAALVDGFFRTIGVSEGEIPTADEREALWELAQLEGATAVRERLLGRWFETAEAFWKGNARSGQGFRAATGLNLKYHERVITDEQELCRRVVAAMENSQQVDPFRLANLGNTLAALAVRLDPQTAAELASRGAQRLLAAMENPQQDPDALSSLGIALAALAARMEPQAAAEIASQSAQRLVAAMENPQQTDPDTLSDLGDALAGLAAKVEPQAAAEIAKGLAMAMENPEKIDSRKLLSLGNALAAFSALLPSAYRTHLLALSNMLLQPLPKKATEGRERSNHRKLLEEVCAHLSQRELAELLKYPFCTGEAEQIVLVQLKAKTGPDFGGDVWKFVEQANSLGINDIDSPAERPSVVDAIKELNAL